MPDASEVLPQAGPATHDRQAAYEALTRQLAEEQAELATLENRLAAFEVRYARSVGVLFAELDDLERQIAEELLRLHPDAVYRRRARAAERQARTSRQRVEEHIGDAGEAPFQPSPELRDLYRRVAKAVHPDLAADEEERAYRNMLMARANAAYRDGDSDELHRVLAAWEEWQAGRRAEAPCEPIDEGNIEARIARLRARISEIQDKIAELRASDLYRLMMRVERAELQGHNLLSEMAREVRSQIEAARRRLASLKQSPSPQSSHG